MDPSGSVKYGELLPLQWYDSLSPDAQRVMVALQRKYAKMREQILLTQMKKELFSQDPSEYYKSLYTRQFKAEPSSSSRNRSFVNQAVRNQVNAPTHWNSVTSQATADQHSQIQSTEESIQIKQEPPNSPFPPEQFNGPHGISDKMIHSLHPGANSINQMKDPANSFSSRNVMRTPVPTIYPCDVGHLVTYNQKTTETQKRKRPEESVHTNFNQSKQNKLSSLMLANRGARQCYAEMGNLNHCGLHFSESESSQQFAKSQTGNPPKTSFSLEFSIEECDLSPVPPVHFPLEPDFSNNDFDMDLYEASQDLFASTRELQNKTIQGQNQRHGDTDVKNISKFKQNQQQQLQQDQYCHVSNQDEVYEERINAGSEQKSDSRNRNEILKDLISLDQSSNQVFQKPSEVQQHSHVQHQKSSKQLPDTEIIHQHESLQKENHPQVHSNNNQQVSAQKPASCQSRMDSFLQKLPCSVSRKLEFNRKIRLTEDGRKQTPNAVSGKTGTSNNERIKFPNFGKQQKPKGTTRKGTEISMKGNNDQTGKDDPGFLDAGLVDVTDLSNVERESIRDSILQSRIVCLTLVYSNNTTLIGSFHPTCLQLKYLAIKTISGEPQEQATNKTTSTLLFHYSSEDEIYMNWFKGIMKDLMDNISIEKIAMNAKQLCTAMFQMTVEAEIQDYMLWKFLDPVIGSWLLNSDRSPKCLQDVIKESGIRQTINVMQGELKSLDSDLIFLNDMMTLMKKRLKSQNLWELFYNIETRLVPVLSYLEMQKLLVHTETFISFSSVLKKKLKKLEEKAFASVGHSFCINSHPQLRQVLYEELRLDEKLPAKSKIAKTSVAHQKSTSEATLTQLKDTHSLPAIILEYRQLQKLKSTYVDGMMSCVKNGYLSTHWDQIAAATGRLTSCQPNVQAIPKVPVTITEYEDSFIIGKTSDKSTDIYAREPFISHEGHLLLAADFQQIELRLLAHLADDSVLLGIFSNKEVQDIFIELTSQWLGKPVTEVSPSEREQTKRIVYSVMYGVGKEKLADYLKVSSDNAKSIMTSFLLKFPAVNSFTKKCVDFCQQHGFTQTIFKRKRLIPHINHSSYQLRAQAGRQAVNFCVQGSVADLCKAAMLCVQDQLAKHSLTAKARLLAQIHDELLWEVDEKYLKPVKDIVKLVMEDSKSLCGDLAQLNVPIRVTLSEGKSWAHLYPSE